MSGETVNGAPKIEVNVILTKATVYALDIVDRVIRIKGWDDHTVAAHGMPDAVILDHQEAGAIGLYNILAQV
jgi:hypothetical protein